MSIILKLNDDEKNTSILNEITTDDNLKIYFNKQELGFYKLINDYFNKCESFKIDNLIDIINGKATISLRIIDWFVTNFAKYRNKIQGLKFDVRISYKAQLKTYTKKYFDPFRRTKDDNNDKFIYTFKVNKKEIYTTLGQLNFFKWLMKHELIEYINENYIYLKDEMKNYKNDEKNRKKNKINELQNTSTETINTTTNYSNGQIIIKL